MDDEEKLALLALVKGFRKTLRRMFEQVYTASGDLYCLLDETNDLIDQLAEKNKSRRGG